MGYSIGQVAKKMGLTAHTLRYYEKEGLLPFVRKTSSGVRVFSDQDVEWLVLIECLKGTGMLIKDIKTYIDWYIEGDSTLQKRMDMFKRQKEKVEEKMVMMKKHLEKIEYKIKYYEQLLVDGKSDQAQIKACLNEEMKKLNL